MHKQTNAMGHSRVEQFSLTLKGVLQKAFLKESWLGSVSHSITLDVALNAHCLL